MYYSPKESSLELPWGSNCLGTLFLTLLAIRFSPPLRPIRKHPTYSPKESSLELPWGSHCLGTLFLTLLAFRFFAPLRPIPKHPTYSPKESSLKNSPRGPIGRVLSLPCIIGWKILSPRRSMKKFFLLCGWWWCGGVVVVVVWWWWGVLPFGTLDHVMTIFFKFLVL